MTVKVPKPWPQKIGEKYRSCWLCGGTVSNHVEIRFDTGIQEPTVGSTLTGATSGDTGVVTAVQVESGTWDGGDAAGTIWMSSPTGFSDINTDGGTGEWGQDNEALTSGGVTKCVMNGHGHQKRGGILYPESDMVEASDGHWYCKPHWSMRFLPDLRAENPVEVDEDDRGT